MQKFCVVCAVSTLFACSGPAGKFQTIGPGGGTVAAADGSGVTILPGALTVSTPITVTAAPDAVMPAGVVPVGTPYIFGPEGQRFAVPATVTLAFEASLIPQGDSPQDIVVYTAPAGTTNYVALPTRMVDASHVQVSTPHFSVFVPGVRQNQSDDGGMTDAGQADAGSSDAGMPDAGPMDAGMPVPSETASTLTVAPGSAVADGATPVTIDVAVRDANGMPIPGASLSLSSTGAGDTIATPEGTADSQGDFSTTLVSTTSGVDTVTATIGSIHLTAMVTFVPGAPSTAMSSFTALPPNVTADGETTTTLSVVGVDGLGNPLIGQTVTFTASGTANTFGSTSGKLDAHGRFSTTLSSTVAQQETITASIGFAQRSVLVTFTAGAPSDKTSLTAMPTSVTADGISAVTVTLVAIDAQGNPVPDATVTPSSNGTSIVCTPSTAQTDADGAATFTATSTVAQAAVLTLTAGSIAESAAVTFTPGPPASLTILTATPGTATADGSSAITLNVVALDAYGNPVPGATVTPSSNGTSIVFAPSTAQTNAAGQASFTATSTVARSALVTLAAGSAAKSAMVTFVPGPVSATTSSVVASPVSAIADGMSSATVTVTALDAFRNRVPGQSVTLSGGTSTTFTPASGTTGANGQFSATMTSTVAQSETITATIAQTVQVSTPFSFVAGLSQANSSIATSSVAQLAVGIVVTIRDTAGNPVAGQTVTVSNTDPNADSIMVIPSQGTTDAAGQLSVIASRSSWIMVNGISFGITAIAGNITLTMDIYFPECAGSLTYCAGPVPMCTDPRTDPSNCGYCGKICRGTTPYCVAGVCVESADGGTPDAGSTDAGSTDAGTPDAGVTSDGGAADGGSSCTPDAGLTIGATSTCTGKLGGGSTPGCVTTLYSGGDPRFLALDDNNVYWTDYSASALLSVPKQGGAAVTLGTTTGGTFAIAVDSNNIYWTSQKGAVLQTSKAGVTTVLSSTGVLPLGITVDSTNVYWTDGNAGLVLKTPIGGGVVTTLASGQAEPDGIAVSGTTLYWTTQGGTVLSSSTSGGPITTIASGWGNMAYGLVAFNCNLLWASTGGVIGSVPLEGGTVISGSGAGNPTNLASDGSNVYLTSGASILEAPIGGAGAATLVSGQNAAYAIAVDSSGVYWTSRDGVQKWTPVSP